MPKLISRKNFERASLLLLVGFYLVAGLNHFRDPDFYYPLIPPFLIYIDEINLLAGVFEIALAMGLIFVKTRKVSAMLIVLMLVAFIPSHIYFIQIEACIEGGLCVPSWVAWFRLLIIHPLLILWAWKHRD